MRMWLKFLECFSGSVYFPESQWLDNDQLQLFLLIVLEVRSWAVPHYLALTGPFSVGLPCGLTRTFWKILRT